VKLKAGFPKIYLAVLLISLAFSTVLISCQLVGYVEPMFNLWYDFRVGRPVDVEVMLNDCPRRKG